MMLIDYLKDLSSGLQLMAQRNDVIRDTHGNLSVIDEFRKYMFIKPSGVPYDYITSDMISGIRIADGLQEFGLGHVPSVDTIHHLEIYRRNPAVQAICHTHSPYATSFAMAGRSIPCCSTEQADYFGHEIRCLCYRDLETWGSYAAPEHEEKALLLEHHGTLTFGKNAVDAVKLAIALENVAQKTHLMLSIAARPSNRVLPDEEIAKWNTRYQNVYGQK